MHQDINGILYIETFTYSRILCVSHLNFSPERDVIIAEFLRRDVCRLYADRFLLAVVFVYFMRAGLDHQHYDRLHFFGAL